MLRPLVLFTILQLLCMVPVVHAQSQVDLGTVIINADTGSYRTGDVSGEEISSFSSVIKKDSFQARSEDVAGVVEKESGVQVRQTGGLGSFSSISLRGASSSQVMVFVDGVPLNDASGGGVDLGSIPLSDVESIEIYKGITPVNFGRSSIGGAVNVRTKRNSKDLGASLAMRYGSFGTFSVSPFLSHKPGSFDYVMSGDYQSSRNDFTFLNNNGTKWNPSDDRWEKRNNAQFHQGNALFSAGYDITKDTRLELSNQFFSKQQNLPSWNNSPDIDTSLYTIRNMSFLKVTVNDIGSLHLNSASRLDYSYKSETYDDRDNGIGLSAQYSDYVTSSYGYNGFLEWPTEHNVLDLVLDVHREGYRSRDLLTAMDSPSSSRNFYSLSAENRVLLLDGSLVISPALSLEYYENRFDSSTSPRKESHGYLDPKIGVKYAVTHWATLRTNAARYVREPSFFELFGDRGFFTGNSGLRAERGVNFDIGAELGSVLPYTLLGRIMFNTAYFRTDVDDVISYAYNSRGVGQAVNISSSTINGVETGLSADILRYLSLALNYTWQSAVNENQVQAFNGKKLPGRFEHSASLKLDARYGAVKPYYEFIYASGLFYDSANLLPAPIKREHNLGMMLFVGKFTLSAEVKNVGDDHYEDFNGYPQPGRSYWLTARFDN